MHRTLGVPSRRWWRRLASMPGALPRVWREGNTLAPNLILVEGGDGRGDAFGETAASSWMHGQVPVLRVEGKDMTGLKEKIAMTLAGERADRDAPVHEQLWKLAHMRACMTHSECLPRSIGYINKAERISPGINCLCKSVFIEMLNVLGRRHGLVFRVHYDTMTMTFDVMFEGVGVEETQQCLDVLGLEEVKGQLVTLREALCANDGKKSSHPLSRLPFRNLLAQPVYVEGDCMGWVVLVDEDRQFSREDELMLHLLVNDVAHNMEQVVLLGELNERNRLLGKEKSEQESLLKKLQEAQDQLLQSEKLASIGQLAAGVAHEINNPVGYVNSNVSSMVDYMSDLFALLEEYAQCEEYLPEQHQQSLKEMKQRIDLEFMKDDVKNLLDESQEGMRRIKKIVQDLKDFAHVREEEWQEADIHSGLDSTLNIVHNELKYKAEVIKEYGNLPLVECIAPQINQVLMNLLVNASHAIEQRGTITIRTGREGDDWVWISISDTGKGIARENLQRIFDPFFTTKPVGQGTGLGLSLSFSIISKHNGKIEVESEVGKGTTFTVRLPVRQQKSDENFQI